MTISNLRIVCETSDSSKNIELIKNNRIDYKNNNNNNNHDINNNSNTNNRHDSKRNNDCYQENLSKDISNIIKS